VHLCVPPDTTGSCDSPCMVSHPQPKICLALGKVSLLHWEHYQTPLVSVLSLLLAVSSFIFNVNGQIMTGANGSALMVYNMMHSMAHPQQRPKLVAFANICQKAQPAMNFGFTVLHSKHSFTKD